MARLVSRSVYPTDSVQAKSAGNDVNSSDIRIVFKRDIVVGSLLWRLVDSFDNSSDS